MTMVYQEHWDYVGDIEEKLAEIENVIKAFFKTPANPDLLTDTSEAYVTLGKIKDIMEITIITSEKEK